MYAYTAETGHTMDFATVAATNEDIARDMARRSFAESNDGRTAREVRATYSVIDHGPTATGAIRFTVTTADGTDTLTVFVGARDEIDALVW